MTASDDEQFMWLQQLVRRTRLVLAAGPCMPVSVSAPDARSRHAQLGIHAGATPGKALTTHLKETLTKNSGSADAMLKHLETVPFLAQQFDFDALKQAVATRQIGAKTMQALANSVAQLAKQCGVTSTFPLPTATTDEQQASTPTGAMCLGSPKGAMVMNASTGKFQFVADPGAANKEKVDLQTALSVARFEIERLQAGAVADRFWPFFGKF
jgi:hypothetical protein